MVIKVILNPSFKEEKEYTLRVLLHTFLGLEYIIEYNDDINTYQFVLQNGSILEIIECTLWQKGTSYLNKINIPKEVSLANNKFIIEPDLPILYGNDTCVQEQDKITCGIDIFASSFFMLSRWEEYVVTDRDKHNRFPASASLAHKNDFLHRPIVNEYTEMLWHMLSHLGINQERKKREYSITLTHDVDDPFFWKNNSYTEIAKEMLRAIKNRNFRRAISRIKSKINIQQDPFFTFDKMMDISEQNNLNSHFFFMAGGNTQYDDRFSLDDARIEKLIFDIEKRGHVIGFHPSYDAYNDDLQFEKELQWLQSKTNNRLTAGREHYLRFEVPRTWQIWENHQMEWDSSMSYADVIGFRCGTCYPFPVFNILEKKALNLVERPLIAMEATLYNYMSLDFEEIQRRLISLKETVQLYNGEFVFLWHNSFFHKKDFGSRLLEYEKIVNIINQ